MFKEKKSFKSLVLELPFHLGALILMSLILIALAIFILTFYRVMPLWCSVVLGIVCFGKFLAIFPYIGDYGDTKEVGEGDEKARVRLTAREQLAQKERFFILMYLIFFSLDIVLLIMPILYIFEKYIEEPFKRAMRWLFSPIPSFQIEK